MNKSSRRIGTSCTLGVVILLGTSSQTFANPVILQKVPALAAEQAPSYPQNLARYHLGAQVQAAPTSRPIANLELSSNSEDRNSAEAALLCDDPTVGYAIPTGTSTLLISLPKIENVGSVAFLNKGAKGKMTIATSNTNLAANSSQWHNASEQDLSSDSVRANVGPTEAKYVRLTFNATEPGRIAGFGVYPSPQVSDFTKPRPQKFAVQDKSDSFALISYNYTDIHTKARALYVSSGSDVKQANNMIDDQTATTYAFAPEDMAPTAVIDLGKSCALRRLSAVYSPRAGHMEFYVLQSLPQAPPAPNDNSATTGLTIDDATFANMKAVGSANDDGNQGRASVDFPETSGRYVMVRWTPTAQAANTFSLAEVAAFGRGTQNTLLAANDTSSAGRAVEDEGQSEGQDTSDGKTMRDPKDAKDAKDIPAEGPQSPAEGPPPSLPQAPPFTFVPVLVPTSP